MTANEFAQRVIDMRGERGLTQRKLALQAGISPGTLSRIEAGEHLPNLDVAAKIARALNVPIHALVVDTEPNEIPHQLRLIARKVGKVSEEKRNKLLDLLDQTIDIALSFDEGNHDETKP